MKNDFPVILDVDTGIDDAVAIAMACYQHEIDVKLITCCFGNAEESWVVRNTLTVLENIKRPDIPVVKGFSAQVTNELQSLRAHGVNGLGGYKKHITTKPLNKSCVKAIHDVVQTNDITYIIACGPYTNIAKYLKAYPEDIGRFKLIAVTGTNYPDDNKPYLNFNITIDMPSFKYVLEHLPDIIFCTSDMGHKAYIPTKDFIKSAQCGEVGRFFATLFPSHKDRTVKDGTALHDACGVAWLVKPDMFKISYAYAYIKKGKDGNEYLKFDYDSEITNVVVTTDIKRRKFLSWYYDTLRNIGD